MKCDGDEDRWREVMLERNRRKEVVVVAAMMCRGEGGGGGDGGGSSVRSVGKRRWVLGN